MISLNIDVNKIDKERLYKGVKGTYLDAVLIPTPQSEYGDYMIVESVSKEEREAGKKGTILGNAKNLVRRDPQPDPPHSTHAEYEKGGPMDDGSDDLPF